ncbi:T9SS type A sorting domain-containing protein [Neolewinella aurantiaca]|uniref:T9SS type A sorting domain-containing protein n=1 Tax=Neolewinella aurantiaca TaxID=2602767 RepID=A0A5C7FQF8_9BACT|nr:T9SS type A sorting domain-containing protein [Neolewinella aurantiaca]TXF87606.1 T9SS type A sorting domain-containing protein [Neolewinella aurantiaca]
MKYFTRLQSQVIFLLFFFAYLPSLQAQLCCCAGETVPDTFGDCNATCSFDYMTGDFADGACSLPVGLTKFVGTANKSSHVLLNWQTANESNNLGFEVERADVDLEWRTIDFVEGAGTRSVATDYSFVDRTPFIGNNYYRLKQVDFDGTATYSEVITVNSEETQNGIATVFPTVAREQLYIRYDSELASSAYAAIYDVNGYLITELEVATSVVDISGLKPGHYVVVFNYEGQTFTERFLRSK